MIIRRFDCRHAALRLMVLAITVFCAGAAQAQTQGQLDQARSEIGAVLTSFKDMINARSVAKDLDYTHLLPYFDANFKHDGAGVTEVTADFADGLRGGSISSVTVASVLSLATDANGNSKASTTGTVSATTLDGTFTDSWSPTARDFSDFAWFYKPAGGSWKLYGNQEPGRIRVEAFIENRQSGSACQGCDGVFNFTWFDAQVPPGQFSSITVTGPGFDAVPLVVAETDTREKQASPLPAAKVSFPRQNFKFNGPAVASLPAPGSVYTFTLTPVSGQPFPVTRTVPQTTSQTISVTSPTGHALVDAKLGGALTINWTLPTFPVQNIDLWVSTSSAAGMCNGPELNTFLATNATSYTFSPMPTQCLGQPIADNVSQAYPASVVVAVTGTNGETTRAWYSFGIGTCNGINTPPGSVSASSVAANLVQLQWIRACMPTTIANYTVWRSTSPSGPFTQVGISDQNTRSFSDNTALAGVTYYYYVTANDTSGNKSAASNQITVATPASGGGGSMSLSSGWNLVGNGVGAALDIATTFGDKTKVATVWKWVPAKLNWAFYSPIPADGGQAYATGKGYEFLTAVNGGEGFWVNAVVPFTATLQASGTAVNSTSFKTLGSGWNLLAIGDGKTPSEFNRAIDNSVTPPSPGVIPLNLTSLWAWDNGQTNWYFYAPSLDASGTLSSYVASKQYLGFGAKTLSPATGFWVNRP